MKKLLTLLTLLCLVNLAQAQDEATRKKHYNITDGVALSGYDPITYFAKKPVPGKATITSSYIGITYHFINEKSKALFDANPTKYEPAYGGWCAYALAKKNPEKMEADPETYKIVAGELYVFYNSFGINTIKKWNKDETKSKASADKAWANFLKE